MAATTTGATGTTTGARPAAKTAASKTTASSTPPAAPAGPAGPAGPGAKIDLPAAMQVLSEGDVLTPEGLYAFLEALRVVSTGAAFFVESAGTQLERAVKRGARANSDGRLTLEQKLKMRGVLRRVARGMSNAHDDLFAVAKDAMNAYTPMEAFLEELAEADNRTSRPHRSSRGGFDPFGGR